MEFMNTKPIEEEIRKIALMLKGSENPAFHKYGDQLIDIAFDVEKCRELNPPKTSFVHQNITVEDFAEKMLDDVAKKIRKD
jgi:hypothetical protein